MEAGVSLEEELLAVGNMEEFICKYCQDWFTTQKELIKHLLDWHFDEFEDVKDALKKDNDSESSDDDEDDDSNSSPPSSGFGGFGGGNFSGGGATSSW